MELQELYRLIDLPSEITEKLEAVGSEMDPEQYEGDLERLTEPETAEDAYGNLCMLLGEDPGNFKMLYCQLKSALRVAEKYEKKGISRQIYADTMKCFSRFIGECEKKNGSMFFDRGWWTHRQISMTIFRIGSLEYELWSEEDEKIIAVHIPSDADLSGSSVDDSLNRSVEFFKKYYPDFQYQGYRCESWLLSPVLKSLLPKESNILSFQNRFEILKEDPGDQGFVEWLFRKPKGTDYNILPEETSLQRKVKELLLRGGKVGAALGSLKPGYTVRIVPMTTDGDIDGKGYVHWKSWHETYSGLVDPAYMESLTLDKCIDTAHRWLDNILVAKDGEKVIGFVGYGVSQDDTICDCGEIYAIYVLADYQGQKVGYKLMNAAFEKLADYRQITVWVLKGNNRAVRFYERYGFRFDGTEKQIRLGTMNTELRMIYTRR